jgi:hypothetical protein
MRLFSGFIICVLAISCKGKQAGEVAVDTNDTIQFYQVSQFIKSQVNEVLKTPYYIYKKTTQNGKTDSVAITNEQFAALAERFSKPDITSPDLKNNYTENAFFDNTTKNYNLNYSTRNKDLEIQNIDVLLKEDGETLNRIFIRKFFSYSDSSAIEQLSWKPNESFQISRMIQMPDGKESLQQTIVVWNGKK